MPIYQFGISLIRSCLCFWENLEKIAIRLLLTLLAGIGFIGAGAILRGSRVVHRLTTATTLWLLTVSVCGKIKGRREPAALP